MFRDMNQYQKKVKEVLKEMNKEVGSEEFSTADDNHKKKMQTAINALQGIVNYMSSKVVERKYDKEAVYERNGTKL